MMMPQQPPKQEKQSPLRKAISETMYEIGGYGASLLRFASWVYIPALTYFVYHGAMETMRISADDMRYNLANQTESYGYREADHIPENRIPE